MSFLDNLSWRYATKKFDTTKKVSETDLEKILEAIRMTPTAYGLQPYHFYVVTNDELKQQIEIAARHQPQVSSASHLLVFTIRTDLETIKEEHIQNMTEGNPEIRAKVRGYEDRLISFLASMDKSGLLAWAAKQAYIAQGFALAACAELQIDSCPMEGFDSETVGKILKIPDTQKAVLLLPIGYREVSEVPRPKVRFPKEYLFTEIH